MGWFTWAQEVKGSRTWVCLSCELNKFPTLTLVSYSSYQALYVNMETFIEQTPAKQSRYTQCYSVIDNALCHLQTTHTNVYILVYIYTCINTYTSYTYAYTSYTYAYNIHIHIRIFNLDNNAISNFFLEYLYTPHDFYHCYLNVTRNKLIIAVISILQFKQLSYIIGILSESTQLVPCRTIDRGSSSTVYQ